MSERYRWINDDAGRWIGAPNNGGEISDPVDELNDLLKQGARLRAEITEMSAVHRGVVAKLEAEIAELERKGAVKVTCATHGDRAFGLCSACVSAGEAEAISTKRDQLEKYEALLVAYRFVFQRKVLHDQEAMVQLKCWQPKLHAAIMADLEAHDGN